MAVNSLYPGFVKLIYEVSGRPHQQVLPVIADTPVSGVEPNFLTYGGDKLMSVALDEYDDLIDDFYSNSGVDFIMAEYWNIASVGATPVLFYTLPLGHAGANAGATVPYSQSVFSFRSRGGGILKLYFMETRYSLNLEDAYPFSAAERTALGDYLTSGSDGWVAARDGTFPLSPYHFFTKTNDALRKKYILNS